MKNKIYYLTLIFIGLIMLGELETKLKAYEVHQNNYINRPLNANGNGDVRKDVKRSNNENTLKYISEKTKEKDKKVIEEINPLCDLDNVICDGESEGIIREVSAYNVGDPNQTDDSPCIGAFGNNICELLEKGECIVASNAYKKNTILEIQNIGKCRVLDRMNSRYKNRVDLAMPLDEKERAINWGIKKLLVINL